MLIMHNDLSQYITTIRQRGACGVRIHNQNTIPLSVTSISKTKTTPLVHISSRLCRGEHVILFPNYKNIDFVNKLAITPVSLFICLFFFFLFSFSFLIQRGQT